MRDHLLRFASPLAFFGLLAACGSSSPAGNGHGGAGSGTANTNGSTSTGVAPSSSGSGGGTGSNATSTSGTNTGPSSTSTSSTSTSSTSTSNATSTSGSGSTSSGAGGSTGWTPVALLDDMTDPQNTVVRSGNDLVTGIYFKSLTEGWVTTAGSNGSSSNGGAVYAAQQKLLTSILFSGNRNGLCLVGSIDFNGIDPSPDGLVALAYACDVIASHDGGKTFGIQSALAGDSFGIERVLTMRSRSAGTVMVADTGYLATTTAEPGPSALWTTIWAPQASPTVPDPVPAADCQLGPPGTVPTQRTSVYVSADGTLAAYVATADDQSPIVCVSTDGGQSFLPKSLPNVPSDATDLSPTGVTFASATTGIAFWGSNISASKYIYRTTDGGQTWASVATPSAYATKTVELASAFFAPDGMTGFIVGYDYDDDIAVLLRTTDAGATWAASGGDLAAKVSAAGGNKLFSGFALDANHIWVGGDFGVLMASDTSGQ